MQKKLTVVFNTGSVSNTAAVSTKIPQSQRSANAARVAPDLLLQPVLEEMNVF